MQSCDTLWTSLRVDFLLARASTSQREHTWDELTHAHIESYISIGVGQIYNFDYVMKSMISDW